MWHRKKWGTKTANWNFACQSKLSDSWYKISATSQKSINFSEAIIKVSHSIHMDSFSDKGKYSSIGRYCNVAWHAFDTVRIIYSHSDHYLIPRVYMPIMFTSVNRLHSVNIRGLEQTGAWPSTSLQLAIKVVLPTPQQQELNTSGGCMKCQ